jgi:hypothetical protein
LGRARGKGSNPPELELDVEEGLVEVGDDVFDIFDADREPD